MRLLEEGIRSYVLLPLCTRAAAHRRAGAWLAARAAAFDEATLARLQPLADAVALALENVRLFQKTRELSITDEVTPLHNFRYFHQILDRELKLVDRYKSVLSLMFMDLDRFKPINDQYGHLRGSRTLREVGFLIRAAVRETDYPGALRRRRVRGDPAADRPRRRRRPWPRSCGGSSRATPSCRRKGSTPGSASRSASPPIRPRRTRRKRSSGSPTSACTRTRNRGRTGGR